MSRNSWATDHGASGSTSGRPTPGVRPALLWFGFLGGGAAWFLHHSLGYGLVEVNCHSDRLAYDILGADAALVLGLLVTAVAAAVALTGAVVAFKCRTGNLLSSQVEEPGNVESRGRIRFMAYGGTLLSSLFLLAILAGGAAFLFLRPC